MLSCSLCAPWTLPASLVKQQMTHRVFVKPLSLCVLKGRKLLLMFNKTGAKPFSHVGFEGTGVWEMWQARSLLLVARKNWVFILNLQEATVYNSFLKLWTEAIQLPDAKEIIEAVSGTKSHKHTQIQQACQAQPLSWSPHGWQCCLTGKGEVKNPHSNAFRSLPTDGHRLCAISPSPVLT